MPDEKEDEIVLCSECFADEGLRLSARVWGSIESGACPNCGKEDGCKLSYADASQLAWRFFTWGSTHRFNYGAAPLIVSNETHKTDIALAVWSGNDLRLFEQKLGRGFFLYGPRLWMLGEVEPLKELLADSTRPKILQRVLAEYPKRVFTPSEKFYRIRKGVTDPIPEEELDSPPPALLGNGRLESPDLPVFYGGLDLETCIHECRLTVLDESFVATLAPARDLHLLDLTHLLVEKDVSEFDSLDLAIHMLFLAGDYSYPISRDIAKAAFDEKLDGILYPSFFSLARTSSVPLETTFGISVRKLAPFAAHAAHQAVPNIALFGRPIQDGRVRVACVNRLIIGGVRYNIVLGPAGFQSLA
jgi:hypothetical protein